MKFLIEVRGNGRSPAFEFDGLTIEDRSIAEYRDAAFLYVGTAIISFASSLAGGVMANYLYAMSLKIDGITVNPDSQEEIANLVVKKMSEQKK
jgi:hypothetical protein